MNNLEKLKEINPAFYNIVKLKYLTDTDSMKSRIEKLSFDQDEDAIRNFQSLQDLELFERKLKVDSAIKSYFKSTEILKEKQEKSKRLAKEIADMVRGTKNEEL